MTASLAGRRPPRVPQRTRQPAQVRKAGRETRPAGLSLPAARGYLHQRSALPGHHTLEKTPPADYGTRSNARGYLRHRSALPHHHTLEKTPPADYGTRSTARGYLRHRSALPHHHTLEKTPPADYGTRSYVAGTSVTARRFPRCSRRPRA